MCEMKGQQIEKSQAEKVEGLDFMTQSVFLQSAKVHPKRRPDGPAKMEPKVISLADLARHFNMPQHRACEALGICSTSMKKLCKKFGLKRWPYSSLNSAQAYVQEWQVKTAAFFGSPTNSFEKSSSSAASLIARAASASTTVRSPSADFDSMQSSMSSCASPLAEYTSSELSFGANRACSAPEPHHLSTTEQLPSRTRSPVLPAAHAEDIVRAKSEPAERPSPSVVHPLANMNYVPSYATAGNYFTQAGAPPAAAPAAVIAPVSNVHHSTSMPALSGWSVPQPSWISPVETSSAHNFGGQPSELYFGEPVDEGKVALDPFDKLQELEKVEQPAISF